MKQKNSPSLFLLILLFIFGLCLNKSHAQKFIDSTDFYGKILINPHAGSDITTAFNYLKNTVELDLRNNDTMKAVKKLRYLSIGQKEMGALFESEETSTKALHLLDKLSSDSLVTASIFGLYNNLGIVYRLLHNPINSLYFYDKALQISATTADSLAILNNKGNLYVDLHQHERAQQQFNKGYTLSRRISDSINQARSLSNLGFSQSKIGHPEALKNLLHGLRIRLRNDDLLGVYSSYAHLAEYYHDRNQEEKALEYAEKAYEIAHQTNSPSYVENSLTNLLKIKNDPISKEFIKLTDSIKSAKLLKQNKYAGMQYNLSKERENTEANRLLQEKEKRKKQGFQFLGILLFIGIFAVYIFQRSHNRKLTVRKILNTEARISKKVHDEVANDVYHLMTKIQLTVPDPDAILDDLEGIYNKTRDISRENNALILQEDFGTQLKDLLNSYGQENTIITVQNISKINWNTIPAIKKTTIYRVLQESMTNMKKHSKATYVVIGFQKIGKKLQIQYMDNGVGCNLKSKNGLHNAENRIKAIRGTINFETAPQKGFKITLTV